MGGDSRYIHIGSSCSSRCSLLAPTHIDNRILYNALTFTPHSHTISRGPKPKHLRTGQGKHDKEVNREQHRQQQERSSIAG